MEDQNNQIAKISEVDNSSNNQKSLIEIQDWLISHLSELLEIDPRNIDIAVPFNRFGLDSSAAIGMTGELSEWLGYELEPKIIYDYPTIEALAQHLSQKNY